MPPSTITIAPATDLPAGAVRLLTDALASTRPRLRWVCRLRAVHAAWLLRGLNGGEARVAVARDGDELVGVALAVRYDARPGAAQPGILTVAALALGAVARLVGLPPVGLLTALTITVAAGTLRRGLPRWPGRANRRAHGPPTGSPGRPRPLLGSRTGRRRTGAPRPRHRHRPEPGPGELAARR